MICAKCNDANDVVIDSRECAYGDEIRRRRKCLACGHRWTTYEREIEDRVDETGVSRVMSLVQQAMDRLKELNNRSVQRRRGRRKAA